MKRRIAVFTGTRAEYGLLYWLMKDIQASTQLTLQVIVSGMHLSPEFGETWRQVEADGFPVKGMRSAGRSVSSQVTLKRWPWCVCAG